MEKFEQIEPLKANRWIIETYPTKIQPYNFSKCKLFNEGELIILETTIMETVINLYNPVDLMNLTDITIKYLDPVGDVVNGLKMIIKGVNFEKNHSYRNDGLLLTKLRFIIDANKLTLLFKTEENGEQRAS
jgi:hypothetical protein